ncbi:hypothetical protein [Rothia aeria]|uniref:hypothetical protein n=1 Tax=Rothia aeria TaxID=172042 RepID=UPI00254E4986|nr:hypothetical protein [Rothia aeria]MDK7677624.1 hypothetical protein [Rothia aeria]
MNEKSEHSGSHPHVNSLAARIPAVMQVATLYAAYPMAFVSAVWITVGRALFGAAGDLVPIFAISFGPALAVILCLGAWWMFRDAHRRVDGGEHLRVGASWGFVFSVWTCWMLAFLFGMFIPDYRAGVPVSGMGALVGGEYVGYAAGFGNTFGILTFAAAITAAALAYSANRRGARLQQGVTDEVLEEQARQQSPYDFLD